MNKLAILQRIKNLYENQNVNIIQYLKDMTDEKDNSLEDIMISYDFQAGTYIKSYKENREWKNKFIERLVNIITNLDCEKRKIFEGGVGEAVTLIPLLNAMNLKFSWYGGLDISYSRIKAAQDFAKEESKHKCGEQNLFVGDLFNIPLKDNSIEIVYTCHSMEPNGGREKELLKELYRITKNYLILLEPAYELAEKEAKERMELYGYVKGLYNTAITLGYNVIEYGLYGISANPLNPTGIMIIKKNNTDDEKTTQPICCPLTKTKLIKTGNAYFSQESLLAYPIINGVPCLTVQNAIIATKMI